MKKISIMVGNEFGDNLDEWLSLEGFDTSMLKYHDLKTTPNNTDVYICAEEDLESISSDEFLSITNAKPCIILGEDKAMAPKWLQSYLFLKMPFYFEDLQNIILGCKPLQYS